MKTVLAETFAFLSAMRRPRRPKVAAEALQDVGLIADEPRIEKDGSP